MTPEAENFSIYTPDAIDIAILRELQNNARLTIKELSQKVNLSSTPVFERWRRLESLGYIKKYVAVLDAEKVRRGFHVFCMVKLRRLNYAVAEKFVQRVASIPEVSECYHISGDYDYMLKITVPDMQSYREFILNVLGHLDPVGSIESHFVMDVIKHSYDIIH